MNQINFLERLKQKSAFLENALDNYLPSSEEYPQIIHQAMRYSVMAGGKRLRPVLLLATAEALGKDIAPLIPAACAIELIHTYSLVHDDLPAMDNDDYRRGKLTNHKIYGEALAILVGDALLTLAFELITRLEQDETISPSVLIRVIREVSRASGTNGLIGGQVVDTCYENKTISASELEYIHTRKTGALYRVAVRAGAILSGANEWELELLTKYAENLGLTFQIIDDILDVEGDAQKMGKSTGSDQRNKKATYPSLYGLEAAREKAKAVALEAEKSLEPFGSRALFMRELLWFVLSRDF